MLQSPEISMQEKPDYQIFLNYRGADVRQGLVDCLYHVMVEDGLRVFIQKEEKDDGKNDEEMEDPDPLDEEILQAINECRVYIPIFSTYYASNRCCLQELAAIVESSKCAVDKMIVPILYDVTIHDFLKLAADFLNEEEKFGSPAAQTWKKALEEVENVEVWEVNDCGYIEFSKLITREVLIKFNAKVIENLSGMGERLSAASGASTSSEGRKWIQPEVLLDYSYDVFFSFRVSDTRQPFVDFLGKSMRKADICFFKDNPVLITVEDLEKRWQAINNSEFCVPILSKKYASSLYCLLELEKMVQLGKKIIPVFYGVKPSDVSLESEVWLRLHRENLPLETVLHWERVLQHVARIRGWEFEDEGSLEFGRYFAEQIFVSLPEAQGDQTNRAIMMGQEMQYSGTPCNDYEVFISFRGADVREELADHLYQRLVDAGIHVFRSDKELPVGKRIDTLSQVIKTSKLCIPIFSTAYTLSKWCLRELAIMVEYDKEILPIFYDMEPSAVTLNSDAYQLAKDIFSFKEVQQWKEALQKVASTKGLKLERKSLVDFSLITQEVLLSLKAERKEKSFVADRLVGIKEDAGPLKDVLKLLDVEAPDVRFIGICGKHGTGKTTLAKIVFDRLSDRFDGCSFLANVKESLENIGLPYLRKQLILDILGDRIETSRRGRGISITTVEKELLRQVKVLMVLDDVEGKEQVEELLEDFRRRFSLGSRIIITTRNKNVLVDGVTIRQPKIYEMVELSGDQALELFNVHAFDSLSPLPNHLDLAKQVVYDVGGLPLAIEIIGSFLYRRSLKLWEHASERLRKVEHHALEEILNMCYEELDNRAKQIFLDIACFFTDREKTNAFYMWEACDLLPKKGIKALLSMCLIKITEDNRFWMHDLVREFGTEKIVRQESWKDPTMRSRVWQDREALDILESKKGKAKVGALRVPRSRFDDILIDEEAETLSNLRFLELSEVDVLLPDKCIIRGLPANLKWFSWRSCELDLSTFMSENLVVLDLSRSKWRWEMPHFEGLHSLKVLDLSYCVNLTHLPQLSNFKSLERLVLEGCESLVTIDSSLGSLLSLKYLNIRECYCLKGLPEELSSLTSLAEIVMKGNGGPFRVPEAIGKLKSLLILEIIDVQVSGLPESIGELKQLRKLSLFRCSGIQVIPESLGHLQSLVELDISHTYIRELPGSIGDLKELKRMKMECCSVTYLPGTVGSMEKLEELYVKGCTHLRELPESIGNLSRLRILDLSDTAIWRFPKTINQLSLLETLRLATCQDHNEIPELPTSLKRLDFKGSWQQRIPNLSKLHNLVDMVLCDTSGLKSSYAANQESTELHNVIAPKRQKSSKAAEVTFLDANDHSQQSKLQSSLGDGPGVLPKLVTLTLSIRSITSFPCKLGMLNNLKTLTLSCWGIRFCPQFPSSLSKLVLRFLSPQTELLHFSNLLNLLHLEFDECSMSEDILGSLEIHKIRSLEHLYIKGCSFKSLRGLHLPSNLGILVMNHNALLSELPQLEGLKNLRQLSLLDCPNVNHVAGLGQLASLKELSIRDFHELEELPNLSSLGKLEVLRIEHCKKLQQVEGLPDLQCLQELFISGCDSLRELEDIWILRELRVLELEVCKGLKYSLGPNILHSLQELLISGCDSLKRLRGFYRLPQLRVLKIDSCKELEYIDGLDELNSLQELFISGCNSLKRLSISWLPYLRVLKINDCKGLMEINELVALESWQELFILGCDSLTRLGDFWMSESLRVLKIDGCKGLEEIDVGKLSSLQELFISGCDFLKRLRGFHWLQYLRVLKIDSCKVLEKIDGLDKLHSLQELLISGCHFLERLRGICRLQHLMVLRIRACKGLKYIDLLDKLHSLKEFFVSGCSSLKSLKGLGCLEHLEVLKIDGCKGLEEIDDLMKLTLLREVIISGCESLQHLPDLSKLKKLRVLRIGSCKKLRDVEGLPGLSSLEDLQIHDCKSLRSNIDILKPMEQSRLRTTRFIKRPRP